MSGYVPKVDDKVRATLGENVLVGEVELIADGIMSVAAVGGSCVVEIVHGDGWLFEQVVSVPTKFGAIIRNNVCGELYVRTNKDDRYPWTPLNAPDEWETDQRGTAGGFTVLFEGVDE